MSDIQAAEEALGPEIDAILGEDQEADGQPGGDEAADEALTEDDLAEEIAEEFLDDEGEGDESDGADEGAEAEPVPEMPKSWSKEDAAAWLSLTPEAREVVARREAERDKHLRKVTGEAAQTRQTVENEARAVLAQISERHAAALQQYAKLVVAPPPDESLLYSNDPNAVLQYQRQEAAYRRSVAQHQELHQQIEQAQAQAEAARQQAHQAEIAADAQRLKDQLPEWFDPSEGPKLQETLQSIGAELGYPPELMQQASSTDILALKAAAEWKAKAAKWDELQKKKMEGVRAAKSLPRMVKPGVKPSKGQQSQQARDRAWEGAKKGDMNAFADFLGI